MPRGRSQRAASPRRRRRRRPLNRGTTPLYWADPPAALLYELRDRAVRSVGRPESAEVGGERPSWWLRRVQEAFYRLLDETRIFVEGHTDVEVGRAG